MPAPITQTSAWASAVSGGKDGIGTAASQAEVVFPVWGRMVFGPAGRSLGSRAGRRDGGRYRWHHDPAGQTMCRTPFRPARGPFQGGILWWIKGLPLVGAGSP